MSESAMYDRGTPSRSGPPDAVLGGAGSGHEPTSVPVDVRGAATSGRSRLDGRRLAHDIDAELCDHGRVVRVARAELAEVRRRLAELIDMEASLVVGIEVRSRRMDDLLDHRLSAGPRRRPGGTPAT